MIVNMIVNPIVNMRLYSHIIEYSNYCVQTMIGIHGGRGIEE